MANLAYRTRAGSAPGQKSRVYFCCHPDDFSLYFPTVSAEILALQDCTVWYRQPSGAPGDSDFWDDLARMQLFVIPVTGRFLRQKNDALSREFSFAMTHHIPVLPLLQEPGLEELFDTVCGDLQVLDRFSQDDTTASYQEKLRRFLSSALLGDELGCMVNHVFRGSIFLSYRKKDRRHAQALMQRIHRSPELRDIAIWYDEFLVPGEDFSDTIRQALHSSDLFVLTVTPNILEAGNYVLSDEYPLACGLKKRIIPVEMVPVDQPLLQQALPGLPPCLRVDAPDFDDQLHRALADADLPPRDNSPQRDYLLGLAYLHGIGAELDTEKAAELFFSAAAQNHTEAMEQLSAMYRTGSGFTRSIPNALYWQRCRVEALKARCTEEADDNTRAYLAALRGLGEELVQLRDNREAEPVLRQHLAECLALAQREPENGEISRQLIGSHEVLGKFLYARRDYHAALEQFQAALTVAEAEHQRRNTASTYWTLASCQLNMGKVYQQLGQPRPALYHCYRFHGAAKLQAEKSGTSAALADLATSHSALAQLYRRLNEVDKALDHHQAAVQLRTQLAEETDDPQARRALADCHEELGIFLRQLKNWAAAAEHAQSAYVLRTQLAKDDGDTDALHRASAQYYASMGALHLQQEDYRGAAEHFGRESDYLTALAADGKESSLQELANALRKQAVAYRAGGEPEKARASAEKAVAVCSRLSDEQSGPTMLGTHANCRQLLAYILANLRRPDEAAGQFRRAAALYKLLTDRVLSKENMNNLAIAQFNLGLFARGQEKLDAFRAARRIWETFLEKDISLPNTRQYLDKVNAKLAEAEKQQKS